MTNEQLLIQISKLYNSYADGGIGSLDECQESILALIQQFREEVERETVEKCQELIRNNAESMMNYSKQYHKDNQDLMQKSETSYRVLRTQANILGGVIQQNEAHFEKGKQ